MIDDLPAFARANASKLPLLVSMRKAGFACDARAIIHPKMTPQDWMHWNTAVQLNSAQLSAELAREEGALHLAGMGLRR